MPPTKIFDAPGTFVTRFAMAPPVHDSATASVCLRAVIKRTTVASTFRLRRLGLGDFGIKRSRDVAFRFVRRAKINLPRQRVSGGLSELDSQRVSRPFRLPHRMTLRVLP